MYITSSAFHDGETIPTKYADYGVVGGNNISLPLCRSDIPPETKSFALSIIDPHPVAKNWIHWLVINIPNNVTHLAEGASGKSMPLAARELFNTANVLGYGGPEPPEGSGAHPYVVTIYALNVEELLLPDKTILSEFTKTLSGKIIATAKLTGIYER